MWIIKAQRRDGFYFSKSLIEFNFVAFFFVWYNLKGGRIFLVFYRYYLKIYPLTQIVNFQYVLIKFCSLKGVFELCSFL